MLLRPGRIGQIGRTRAGGTPTPTPSIGPDRGVSTAWAGPVTHNSFTAAHYLDGETDGTRLVVSTDPTFAGAKIYSGYINTATKSVIHTVSGLAADTQYYFCLEVNSTLKTSKSGSFKTMAAAAGTAQNLVFGFGCCQSGQNNAGVLTAIRGIASPPSFFLHLGDLHYSDIATNSEALFDTAYDEVLNGANSGPFLRNVPTYYVWDDHDFGPNDSDSSSPSRTASIAAYRRRVPKPTLAFTSGATDPVCYSFVQGRVRFIMTDGRSQRTASTIFGAAQLQWIKDEFTAAAAASQFVVMGISGTWADDEYGVISGAPSARGVERAGLADHIRSVGLGRKTIILGGDAHSTQFNTDETFDFSTRSGAPIPEFHAAALFAGADKPTGKFWSAGVARMDGTTIRSAVGVVEITDAGGSSITVNVKSYSTNNSTTGLTERLSATVTLPTTAPAKPAALVQQSYRESHALGDLSPTLDTPATAGNVLIALVAIRGTRPTTFTTTGLTNFGNAGNGAGGTGDADITILAYRMTAVGGETGVTINSGSNRSAAVALLEVATSNPSSPIDVVAWNDQSNASVSSVTVAGTTASDDQLAIAVAGINSVALTQGSPRSWSDGFVEQRWSPQWFPGFSVAAKQLGAAGAVSATFDTGGRADQTVGLLLTVKE